jgi:hypothetical protein
MQSTHSAAVNSSTGLALIVSMNSSVIFSGDSVNLTVSVRNTRPVAINKSGVSNWALPTLGQGFGPCTNVSNSLFRIAAFTGYYTTANISQATPLTVADPSAFYSCTAISQFVYLTFLPNSNNVKEYSCMGSNCTIYGPFPITGSDLESYFQIAGYWTNVTSVNGTTTTQSSAFHPLDNGTYSIAVGDGWGDLTILHFRVDKSAPQPSASSPCNQPTCAESFFSYRSIPKTFAVGDYNFSMVFNGTGYGPIIGNGTDHLFDGYVFVFNISTPNSNPPSVQTLLFNWMPPCALDSSLHCIQNNTLQIPIPSTQTAFSGQVKMLWYSNSTGLWLGVWAASSIQTTGSQSGGLNFSLGQTFHIPTNGTLYATVKYYYFNSTAVKSYNFSSGHQFYIQGFSGHATFDATSNFTVLSNVSVAQIGGPQNSSEGIAVQYKIHPKNNLNGTYTFNFGLLYPTLEACAVDFDVAIGNGAPSYAWTGSCTEPLSNLYRVNYQGFVDGYLLAEVVLVSNETM